MEVWELFLKGLSKTIEEFVVEMVERGKQIDRKDSSDKYRSKERHAEKHEAPRATTKKRAIPYRDLGDLENKILDVIGNHPEGITLKGVASEMGMQWHYLRIPLRQLTLENKVNKDEKIYTLAQKATETGPKSTEPVPTIPKVEEPVLKQTELVTESVDTVQPEAKPEQPRRRVIDASELEKKAEPPSLLNKMSVRDRERLRYRILTALRGRPEGLTLDKLAAVLGMELELLVPILEELHTESKVLNDQNNKYRLP